MISFNLICDHGHGFEGWFNSSADYTDQQARGLVTCPICDSANITKGLMTPNVAAKSNTKPEASGRTSAMVSAPSRANLPPQMTAQITPEMAKAAAETLAAMRKLQSTIEKECDNVGDAFAEEARKIHYGESDPRGIYGQTTDQEAESLLEEGIAIAKMPWLPKEQ
jgi:hypothetical protein